MTRRQRRSPRQGLRLISSARPQPEAIDHFGGCPTCWRNDGYLNIRRENWFICHEHRTRWLAGENLISTWRMESEADWLRNAALIAGYRVVEPVYPPATEEPST